MRADSLKQLIEERLPQAMVMVATPDGIHFEAVVVSAEFEGKTKVQQQQLVYSTVNEFIASGEIHALSLKTYTPASWTEMNT